MNCAAITKNGIAMMVCEFSLSIATCAIDTEGVSCNNNNIIESPPKAAKIGRPINSKIRRLIKTRTSILEENLFKTQI